MKLIFTIGNSFEVSKANYEFNIKTPYEMRTVVIELTPAQIEKLKSGRNENIESVAIYLDPNKEIRNADR